MAMRLSAEVDGWAPVKEAAYVSGCGIRSVWRYISQERILFRRVMGWRVEVALSSKGQLVELLPD